jgi:hypothetical protein
LAWWTAGYQCDGGIDCQHDNGPPERILADADVTKRAYHRPSEGELMKKRDQIEAALGKLRHLLGEFSLKEPFSAFMDGLG